MSQIYSGGVQATAIAAITTEVNSLITTASDGTKVLDAQALDAYLKAQFQAIITEVEYVSPATADSATAAAATVNTAALVASLNNVVRKEHWSTRSDWPTSSSVWSATQIVAAVAAGIGALNVLKDAVLQVYLDIEKTLADKFQAYYESQGIDATVPAGVTIRTETRTVIHTFVNDWDEESAPSPASDLVTLDQNDTATYTAGAAPSGRNIDRIRWYRSQSNNNGAQFEFVDEVPIASLAYTDSKKPEELEEPCPTTTWLEPPANLQGGVGMPNGVTAGFFDNTVCFCEPYHGYAWPAEYRVTVEWPIVGLGVFGQTLFVGTQGNPYFISGADAQSMSALKQDSNQACASRRSIAPVRGGVLFASPDGLCLASSNGVELITSGLFSRVEWQALNPSSIVGAEHDGTYYFTFTGGSGGCYALHLPTGRLTTLDTGGSTLYADLLTDTIYFTTGTSILAMFGGTNPRTGLWRTKRIVFEAPAALGWIDVESEFEATVTVRIYDAGVLWHTATFTQAGPQRLPPGRPKEVEVEIESTARATKVLLAGSTAELRAL